MEEETNATSENGGAENPVFTPEQEAWLQRFFATREGGAGVASSSSSTTRASEQAISTTSTAVGGLSELELFNASMGYE